MSNKINKTLREVIVAATGPLVFAAVVPKYAANDESYTPWIVGALTTDDFERLQLAATAFVGDTAMDELMQWAGENGFVVLTSYLGDGLVVVDADPVGESND